MMFVNSNKLIFTNYFKHWYLKAAIKLAIELNTVEDLTQPKANLTISGRDGSWQ